MWAEVSLRYKKYLIDHFNTRWCSALHDKVQGTRQGKVGMRCNFTLVCQRALIVAQRRSNLVAWMVISTLAALCLACTCSMDTSSPATDPSSLFMTLVINALDFLHFLKLFSFQVIQIDTVRYITFSCLSIEALGLSSVDTRILRHCSFYLKPFIPEKLYWSQICLLQRLLHRFRPRSSLHQSILNHKCCISAAEDLHSPR